MRRIAEGKKLSWNLAVLVLISLRRPDLIDLKRELAGCTGSAEILRALLVALSLYRDCKDGRSQPTIFLAVVTTFSNLSLSS